MTIAVAGGSGFIGRHLINHLLERTNDDIRLLSRSVYSSENPRLQCVQADLYSLLDCERALQGCDVAIYLVHSMSPSSRLSQGHFRDFDFLLADNFAKAAQRNGIKRIFYVGGIIPDKEKLSVHLQSRLEVEETLKNSGVNLISLRCGLVIGKDGSSFRIVEKLVDRLPVMVLPSWTQSKMQGLYVDDLLSIFEKLLNASHPLTGQFDLGAPEKVEYGEILRWAADARSRKPFFLNVRFVSPKLTRLWIRLVTGESKQLVYPLVESLVHQMIVNKPLPKEILASVRLTPLKEAIFKSLREDHPPRLPVQRQKSAKKDESLVQSVQRIANKSQRTAREVARLYMKWLPRFLFPFFKIESEGDLLSFRWWGVAKPLLILEFSESRTFEGRQLFYIKGGLLVKEQKGARLEFRLSPDKTFLIAAIHKFRPALPWLIYLCTQAQVHRFVMWRFGRYLNRRTE